MSAIVTGVLWMLVRRHLARRRRRRGRYCRYRPRGPLTACGALAWDLMPLGFLATGVYLLVTHLVVTHL
jgi:hypothetical protein